MSTELLLGTKWIVAPNEENTFAWSGVVVGLIADEPNYVTVADAEGETHTVDIGRLRAIGGDQTKVTYGTRKLTYKFCFPEFHDLMISKTGVVRVSLDGVVHCVPLEAVRSIYLGDKPINPQMRPKYASQDYRYLNVFDGVVNICFAIPPEERANAQIVVDTLIRERDIINGFIIEESEK